MKAWGAMAGVLLMVLFPASVLVGAAHADGTDTTGPPSPAVRWGLSLSLNAARLNPNEVPDDFEFSNRSRFAGGLLMERVIARNTGAVISLTSGLRFDSRGTNLNSERTAGSTGLGQLIETWSLQYFVIPLHLKMIFGEERARPFLSFGGELGFLQSAEREFNLVEPTVGGGQIGSSGTEDTRSMLRGVDYGARLGVGLEFPAGSHTGFIEFSAVVSLENIVDKQLDLEEWGPVSDDLEMRNRAITFTAGFFR